MLISFQRKNSLKKSYFDLIRHWLISFFCVGFFYVLHQTSNFSFLELFEKDKNSSIYLLTPFIAFLVTLTSKLISSKLKKNFLEENKSFQNVIFGPATLSREISFPAEIIVAVPATILIAVFSSTFHRLNRFLIVYPTIFTVFSVCIPLYIILKNEKIKSFAQQKYVEAINRKIESFENRFRKNRTVKVAPVLVMKTLSGKISRPTTQAEG